MHHNLWKALEYDDSKPRLIVLRIGDAHDLDNVFAETSDFLAMHPQVKSLHLTILIRNLESQVMEFLFALLNQYPQIHSLNCSYAADDFKLQLINFLQTNTTLQALKLGGVLSLKNNKIETQSFAETLKVNCSLRKLDLSRVYFADFKIFAEALKLNRGLRSLNLSHAYIDHADVKILAEVLGENTNLQFLDLSGINFCDEAAADFASALPNNTHLSSLRWTPSPDLSLSLIQAINNSIDRNARNIKSISRSQYWNLIVTLRTLFLASRAQEQDRASEDEPFILLPAEILFHIADFILQKSAFALNARRRKQLINYCFTPASNFEKQNLERCTPHITNIKTFQLERAERAEGKIKKSFYRQLNLLEKSFFSVYAPEAADPFSDLLYWENYIRKFSSLLLAFASFLGIPAKHYYQSLDPNHPEQACLSGMLADFFKCRKKNGELSREKIVFIALHLIKILFIFPWNLLKLISEFVPQLMLNFSIAAAEWLFFPCFDYYARRLNIALFVCLSVIIFCPLVFIGLASISLRFIGKAITSPFNAMREWMPNKEDSWSMKFGLSCLMLLSLATTIVVYSLLWPLALQTLSSILIPALAPYLPSFLIWVGAGLATLAANLFITPLAQYFLKPAAVDIQTHVLKNTKRIEPVFCTIEDEKKIPLQRKPLGLKARILGPSQLIQHHHPNRCD
jgi:hypothetical protein